ncbi:hypothetical protein M409DRAFT_18599 [Zasmidium cellare ATCC 36951]|uniref:Rhodopsin domain-containing protein n=1 Tax=Zasmidium cellare ATCC 36951 TaxID=1080233 RepID=A0A6A6D006_ZASCE|nr:uncharacterized protein M409DRAFT_18599 [Zasmidium cellare ATCC 36951]KAF2171482.1 hypothetical protein M409DRAFT_18599 [Zasmidium cellare ATCC 36951]
MVRFAVDNGVDKSATVWVITLLALIYSCITLGSRVYFKLGSLGREDVAILLGQATACGQFGAGIFALQRGLGMNLSLLSRENLESISGAFTAIQVLYFTSSALSKLSTAILHRLLFHHLESRRAAELCLCMAIMAACWGFASALATSVGCDMVQRLVTDDSLACPLTRYRGPLVADCLLEAALVTLPVYFTAGLQMKRAQKLKVCSAFAFRALCIVFSAMLLWSFEVVVHSHHDDSNLSQVVMWQQAGTCYSLISATIPVSLNFIHRFRTGASVALSSSQKSERGTNGSRQYGKIGDTQRSNLSGSKTFAGRGALRMRPDDVSTSTSAYHVPGHFEERTGSQEMFITRSDSVTVTSD